MMTLLCDLGRAVPKMPSASEEELPESILILDLQLACSSKSLEDLFLMRDVDPPFKCLEFGCHLGSKEELVWSLPRTFKGSLCS